MYSSEKQPEEMTMETGVDTECCCVGEDSCCCSAGEDGEKERSPGDELTAEDELNSLRIRLEEQTNLAAEYFNSLARVQADYDNFKRRTRQEKEDLYKYASEQLIVALLPVLDNFDRAMAAEAKGVEDFKSGVEMIHRQLWNVLHEEGLALVPAVGEPFDPKWHEAVMQEESDEHPENTVLLELQRGYQLKEKLIRVSMVKISKP